MYPLKQRLAHAREAITALPDVERTVEQQEVEIRNLQRMAKSLRQRLAALGDIARKSDDDDDDDVIMDVDDDGVK
jgi:formylmethanofuran dehydrogenase subunit C